MLLWYTQLRLSSWFAICFHPVIYLAFVDISSTLVRVRLYVLIFFTLPSSPLLLTTPVDFEDCLAAHPPVVHRVYTICILAYYIVLHLSSVLYITCNRIVRWVDRDFVDAWWTLS